MSMIFFCFVMPICLFVAFESISQTFPIFYFQPSREVSRDVFLEAIARHKGFLIFSHVK